MNRIYSWHSHWPDSRGHHNRKLYSRIAPFLWLSLEKHINPVIGSVYLDKLTDTDIDKVFKKMHEDGYGSTTQKYVYAVLRKALNNAVRRKIIPYNVVEMVESPKKEKYHPTIIPRERLHHFKKCLEETDVYMPIYLCLGLGLRRGEMLGLRWSDICFETGIMLVQRSATPAKGGYRIDDTKTDSSRCLLLLPQSIIHDLQKHREQQIKDNLYKVDGYVNINCKGDIISASVLNKKFKKFLTDNDFQDMRIHDMRHSYATLMLGKSVSMKVTSQILGHSSVSITSDLYSHMLIGMQKQAVNVINDMFK